MSDGILTREELRRSVYAAAHPPNSVALRATLAKLDAHDELQRARIEELERLLGELCRAADDLLDWAKRYRAGDTSLHPEQWFVESEYTANVVAGARAVLSAVPGDTP